MNRMMYIQGNKIYGPGPNLCLTGPEEGDRNRERARELFKLLTRERRDNEIQTRESIQTDICKWYYLRC